MISKCLFPAAGFGTRFLPATKAVPKEMLPIINKPILQYGVEEAISAGITNIAIVSGKGKRSIEDHFDKSVELESQLKETSKEHYIKDIQNIIEKATFTYVRQKKMLGLGHAILTGQPLIGNQPFAVVLADDLCINSDNSVLKQMLKVFNKYKCSVVAIEEIPKEDTNKYGIIDGNLIDGSNDTFRVTNMVEKPESIDSPSNMAIVGRYILTPDIFEIIKTIKPDLNGEIQITDALLVQAKQGNVIAYKFKGLRFDCGSVRGYIQATNHFAKLEGLI
ncbi:UTP--glucose-1-phosphate uridylyltransferase GalU [Candidatus Thioglobus sp.]|nr:UTP--glucose-1-phosphate uridylyltransferase GalU [Candidatus Thioglobus sp.]